MSGDKVIIPPGNERGSSISCLVGLSIFIAFFTIYGLSTSGPPASAETSDALAVYQNPTPTPTPSPLQGPFLTVAGPDPFYGDRIGVAGYAKPRYVGVTNGSYKVEPLFIEDYGAYNHVEVGWWRQASFNVPHCGFGNIPYIFAAWRINGEFFQEPEPCEYPYHSPIPATYVDQYSQFRVEHGTDGIWRYYFRGGNPFHQLDHPNLDYGYAAGQGERHHNMDQCFTRWMTDTQYINVSYPPYRVWQNWPNLQELIPVHQDPDCKLCENAGNDFTVRWNSASCQ